MPDMFDLKGLQGKDNNPGVKNTIYIGFEDEFAAIKRVKSTTAAGDSVTIDGSHTFLAGKGFYRCYTTPGTGQLKLDPTGERDGRGKKIDFTFFYPGDEKDAAEFDRKAKNRSAIILVETPEGKLIQLGSQGLGVEILGSYDSGTTGSGRRGFTFKVEGYQNGLLFYEGTITRPDGSSIDGVTGVVTPANP